MSTLPRTALYVPGDRPDRFDKAVASGADIVILDLEDAVGPDHKVEARSNVVWWLRARNPRMRTVQVRVNAAETPWHLDDVTALPDDVPIRLPKVESATALAVLEGRTVHALIESATGLERAYDIASHPLVATVALGEADLVADTGVVAEVGLDWMRTRLVVAARAADLPAPLMSAYADIPDLQGLAESCKRGRELGFWGRTAVHPSQIAVIASAFTVEESDARWARSVVEAVEAASGGVAVLDSGAMVDEAMVRRARELLARGRAADG